MNRHSMRAPFFAATILLLFAVTASSAVTETFLAQSSDPRPNRVRTAIASSGSGFLVVWAAAASPVKNILHDPSMTIYMRALGADGVPTQPFALPIGMGQQPSVTWNGREYLVVWGITAPTTGSLPSPSVVALRVRADGSLIDPEPVTLISEVNPFSYWTTVVWSGTQYLVTWSRGMALVDADLHAREISLPPTGGIPRYSATSGGGFVVLSWVLIGIRSWLSIVPVSSTGEIGETILLNGPLAAIDGIDGGYALIWDDTAALHFARLRLDGTMGLDFVVAPGRVQSPHIAASDGRIIAAWQTTQNASTSVCTVRLDAVIPPACSAGLHDPSVAITPASVLMTWVDGTAGDSVRAVMAPAFELPRATSGGGWKISDSPESAPAAVRRADGSVVVSWNKYMTATSPLEVHVGGLSNKGTNLPERTLFGNALDQGATAIAGGTGRTMVLWSEGTVMTSKIRMTIFDDVTGAVIATRPLGDGVGASVAFDGQEWLVAWQAVPGLIRFSVFNSDGNSIASGSMAATLSGSQSAPAVAASGKTFFVAWRELAAATAGSPDSYRIELATVTASGVPSAPVTLDSANGRLALPSVASNGNRVLVSWGTPVNTLRQALFDGSGKQLGKFIEFAWPYPFVGTRSHAMNGDFATLAGNRLALTSANGVALDTFDFPFIAAGADFVVDPANRITFLYSRSTAVTTILAQTVGLPRRRSSNH